MGFLTSQSFACRVIAKYMKLFKINRIEKTTKLTFCQASCNDCKF